MKRFGKVLMGSAAMVSSSAFALPYQIELKAGYGYFDSDTSEYVFEANMYFKPVMSAGHLLAEAAFLERVSHLALGYGGLSIKDYYYDRNQDLELTQTVFEVNYFPAVSNLYFSVNYTKYAVEDDDAFEDKKTFGVKAGFLPIPGILIYTEYQDDDGYGPTISEDKDGEYRPNFSVKYVSETKNNKGVNLEARYEDFKGDTQNLLAVGADIYLSQRFSFGGTIYQQEKTVFGVRTRYFMTNNTHVGAFARTGDDVNEFGAEIALRF